MYKNIIVPIDLSDKQSIKAIFPAAINLAKAFGSELHLVHIIPDFGTKLVEDYLPKNLELNTHIWLTPEVRQI